MSFTRVTHARPRSVTRIFAILALLASGLAAAIFTASPAAASHYRANQITWHQVSGNQVEFHVSGSWRCTFFFVDFSTGECNASVGDTFSAGSFTTGDGGFEFPQFTVTSVDTTNDVITGDAHVDHTYPSAGPFTASLDDCCRLSGPQHVNNPDASIRVESIVDLANGTASPESLIPPIVDCPIEGTCQFQVPGVDPDNRTLKWRFSTLAESSLNQPGPPDATHAATIDANTGLYTWDTHGATLSPSGSTFYSTQVTIEALNAAGAPVGKVAVDFFIRLGSNSTNQQPVFESPTPADGTVINVGVGDPVSFSTKASDPDTGDTVALGMLGKPAAATYSTTSGNPATGSFSWTPTATGDFLITLTAQDQLGLGASPRSITIHVTSANQPPTSRAARSAYYLGHQGQPTAITGSASDPDGDTLTTTWSYQTVGTTTGSCTFADPQALTTTVTCDDDGRYYLVLSVDDGHHAPVTSRAALKVLAPPV